MFVIYQTRLNQKSIFLKCKNPHRAYIVINEKKNTTLHKAYEGVCETKFHLKPQFYIVERMLKNKGLKKKKHETQRLSCAYANKILQRWD